nr:ulp1 protease family, C-terminal catalytic domain-containing protein [Tanacetum cinerariifolium]
MMLSLEFGREDLCLITGFRFGKYKLDPKEEDHSEFRKRVFPKIDNLKGEHLLKLLNEDVKFNQLDYEDVVRVCLLLALDYVFMGHELRHRDYNVVADPKYRKYHLDKLASNSKYEANYVLFGFVFPLKIWGLETFSNSIHWWRKDENVIPRDVAWSNGLKFEKSCSDRLFYSKDSTFHKLTPIAILRSSTRGSSNSKSVNTRVRTKVRHELHVRTEVHSFVHKEEVHTEVVDQEDLLERAVLAQTVKDQQQMIVDLQRRLLSVEQVTKKLRTGPYNVDHLDKNDNQYGNVLVGGLDHQSMDGVSQCMNVDRLDMDVVFYLFVYGPKMLIIPLRFEIYIESIVVDDNDFKDKVNEEACFLTTQQVRDLVEEIFDDTPSGPDSTQVKNVKDVVESDIKTVVSHQTIVDSDGNEIQLLSWTEDLTRSPNAPKRTVTVPEPIMSLFRDKNRMEFRELGDDWAMANLYLSDMLSWYEYPLYYADGVIYDLPWFANNVQKVYFLVNKKDLHWLLAELDIFSGVITIYGIKTRHFLLELTQKFEFQILLYLDSDEIFDKKNIDKASYSISFRYADGVPLQGGLYGDCGLWVCIFLYRMSQKIPLEVDDPIDFALAYHKRMIEFYWKYKMLL